MKYNIYYYNGMYATCKNTGGDFPEGWVLVAQLDTEQEAKDYIEFNAPVPPDPYYVHKINNSFIVHSDDNIPGGKLVQTCRSHLEALADCEVCIWAEMGFRLP